MFNTRKFSRDPVKYLNSAEYSLLKNFISKNTPDDDLTYKIATIERLLKDNYIKFNYSSSKSPVRNIKNTIAYLTIWLNRNSVESQQDIVFLCSLLMLRRGGYNSLPESKKTVINKKFFQIFTYHSVSRKDICNENYFSQMGGMSSTYFFFLLIVGLYYNFLSRDQYVKEMHELIQSLWEIKPSLNPLLIDVRPKTRGGNYYSVYNKILISYSYKLMSRILFFDIDYMVEVITRVKNQATSRKESLILKQTLHLMKNTYFSF